MRAIRLRNDHGLDVDFTGELIGRAGGNDLTPKERWSELHLYRTEAGAYVAHELKCSTVANERTKFRVHHAKTTEGLVAALGEGWLAKRLYEESGLDVTRKID